MGIKRNTPTIREMLELSMWAITPGDPIAYAPHYFLDPLPGTPRKNVLIQICLGDFTVPVATGVSLARAAGLISPARNDLLIQLGVVEGKAVNVDALHGPENLYPGCGVRFHGAGSHAYFLAPNFDNLALGVPYTVYAQRQVAEFFQSDGAVIPWYPIFDQTIP
jgi:hypothetical protein